MVNEALLTGESLPLRKEGVSAVIGADPAQRDAPLAFDIQGGAGAGGEGAGGDNRHRRHVVFAGTKIVQHSTKSADGEAGDDGAARQASVCAVPKAPDGGCPAFVLRTGASCRRTRRG